MYSLDKADSYDNSSATRATVISSVWTMSKIITTWNRYQKAVKSEANTAAIDVMKMKNKECQTTRRLIEFINLIH